MAETALVTAHPASVPAATPFPHVTRDVAGPSEPEPAGEQTFPLEVEQFHSAVWITAVPLPEKVRNRNRSLFLWLATGPVDEPLQSALPLEQITTFSWKNQMPMVAEPFGEKRV